MAWLIGVRMLSPYWIGVILRGLVNVEGITYSIKSAHSVQQLFEKTLANCGDPAPKREHYMRSQLAREKQTCDGRSFSPCKKTSLEPSGGSTQENQVCKDSPTALRRGSNICQFLSRILQASRNAWKSVGAFPDFLIGWL